MRRVAAGALLVICCYWPSIVRAQSPDVNVPTPLGASEVAGRIAALDVGDPRLTKHFYTFRAGPGDLTINLESVNLNGDVDLFTASNLQPLLKISIYAASAGDQATSVAKSIFLRREENILLRVEARTVGDEEGRYRLRFDGPFKIVAPSTLTARPTDEVAPARTITENSRGGKTRRVNSIGARIEDPPAEATAAPSTVTTAEPITPARATNSTAKNDSPAGETPAASAPTASPVPRAARRRPLPRARTTNNRRRPTPPGANIPPATNSKNNRTLDDIAEPPPPPVVNRRRPAAQEEPSPLPNIRLIVELKDGTRVERPMNAVRKLTVEKGFLLIQTTNGTLERRSMAEVLKVTIEP
ncbi:MAG TPA: hypothetical protein VM870_09510 [Pyrinomonadaceae bacterium]|nr:hypothetical protein [Pyrinomonadaceae bacterium]